jgi:hypothetical protein
MARDLALRACRGRLPDTASFHDAVFPPWLGWVSAVFTGLFTLLTFAPFLSWAPALLWLLIAGVGLLVHERRRDAALAPA